VNYLKVVGDNHHDNLILSNAFPAFASHKYIAYRFMSPSRLSAAIEISVTVDPVVWTRIFLMWRGITEEEYGAFAGSWEKEATEKDWKSVIGFTESSKDSALFRVLETSMMECA